MKEKIIKNYLKKIKEVATEPREGNDKMSTKLALDCQISEIYLLACTALETIEAHEKQV